MMCIVADYSGMATKIQVFTELCEYVAIVEMSLWLLLNSATLVRLDFLAHTRLQAPYGW